MKAIKTLLAMIGALLLATAAKGQQITLTFADSFPLTHTLSKEGMVYWMKRVTELSNGAVAFKHYPTEQLIKARAILGAVGSGTVDAGYIANGYYTDKMPLNGVAEVPGLFSSSVQGSRVYWPMLKEDGPLRKELLDANVIPIAFIVMPPYQMVLRREPIKTIGDFRGLKIRSSGGMQNLIIEAMGASPVAMTAPDIYLGIQRGTLDGTMLAAISLKPYKLEEVVKSMSKNVPFGSPGIGMGINAAKFRSLPENIQKVLLQAGDDTVAHLTKFLDDEVATSEADLQKAGVTVYEPSAQIKEEVAARMKSVTDDWAKRLNGRGLPADKVLADFTARAKKGQ